MDTPFFRSTSITPDWVSIVPKKVNIILTIGDLYSVRTDTSGYTNYTVDIVRGCIFNNFSAYFRNKGDNTWYSLFDGSPEPTTQTIFKFDIWAVTDGPTKTMSWDIPKTVYQLINPTEVEYKLTGLIPIGENSLKWHISGYRNDELINDYRDFTYKGSVGGDGNLSIDIYYSLCNQVLQEDISYIFGGFQTAGKDLERYKYSLMEGYDSIQDYKDGIEQMPYIKPYYGLYQNNIQQFNLGLDTFPSPVNTSVQNRNAWVNVMGSKLPSKHYPYIVNNGNNNIPALNIILNLINTSYATE